MQSRNKVDKLAQEYAAATGEAEMAEAKAVRQGEEAEAFRRIADEKRLLAYQLADKWTGELLFALFVSLQRRRVCACGCYSLGFFCLVCHHAVEWSLLGYYRCFAASLLLKDVCSAAHRPKWLGTVNRCLS